MSWVTFVLVLGGASLGCLTALVGSEKNDTGTRLAGIALILFYGLGAVVVFLSNILKMLERIAEQV